MSNTVIPSEEFTIPTDPTDVVGQRLSLPEKLKYLASAAMVGYEASVPLNDGSRIALAAATYAATKDPFITAAVFGTATAVVETGGAIGSSILMDTQKGKSLISKAGKLVKKSKITGAAQGPIVDAALTITVGTSIMLANRQAHEEHSQNENMRYGTILALGASTVAAAQAYAISRGVASESFETTGAGIAALVATSFGINHIHQRVSRRRIHAGVEAYQDHMSKKADGPQMEGMSSAEVVDALSDSDTLNVTIDNAKVPLLTPLSHNHEFNQTYFDTHFSGKKAYYYSDVLAVEPTAAVSSELANYFAKISEHEGLLVSDYRVDDGRIPSLEYQLQKAGIAYKKHEFIDPRNESAASVTHFAGVSRAIAGTELSAEDRASGFEDAFNRLSERDPHAYNRENGVALITSDEIDDKLLENVWAMYQKQFDILIAENPSMQKQTEEDFKELVRSDDSLLIAAFENGEPIAAGYFISDIKSAYWLNEGYYNANYPNNPVWYFPGIVAKAEQAGRSNAMAITGLGTKIAYECGLEPVITFQCTNLSKDYIPRIVQLSIERSKQYKIDMEKIAEYRYVGYELLPISETE